MSIKRISRTRVAAPLTEYVDEEPLATRIGTKEDSRVNSNVDVRAGGPDDTRTGGNVETKASPAVESRVGGNIETRVDTRVETKHSPELWGKETKIGGPSGRDSPTKNRWSV
jgi:hypothetical protein